MTVAAESGRHVPPADATAPRSAVDALIADALADMGEPGLSIRELERRAGLSEGALSTPLKPAQRGKWPTLQTLQRFAVALNRDITTVSRAFSADSIGDAEGLSPRQRQAADLLAKLPEDFQDFALGQLAALVHLARGADKTATDTQPASK